MYISSTIANMSVLFKKSALIPILFTEQSIFYGIERYDIFEIQNTFNYSINRSSVRDSSRIAGAVYYFRVNPFLRNSAFHSCSLFASHLLHLPAFSLMRTPYTKSNIAIFRIKLHYKTFIRFFKLHTVSRKLHAYI